MKPTYASELFLRRQRRRLRGTLLAWAAAAAIASEGWRGAVQLGWIHWCSRWALVPAAATALLLVLWCRRVWRLDIHALAQECDARWELHARVESAVELSGSATAVAVAQRADTAQSLVSKKPVGTLAWIGGIAAALIGLGLVGFERTVMVERLRPPAPAPTTEVLSAAPVPQPEFLRASIVWLSPAKSIQAKATDEIPLIALVESNKGFRSLSLEVAVNSVPTNSFPLSSAEIGTLTGPGGRNLKFSLFADETGAKPHDIISYFIEGDANVSASRPAIVSALQFVEVIPADLAPPGGRYGPDAHELLRQLNELERLQVQMIEQNLELIRASRAKTAPVASMENANLASAQSRLAQTAEESRTSALRMRASESVAADLARAGPLMIQGSSKIAAEDNEAAMPVQAQALSLLADAEQSFRQSLVGEAASATGDDVDARQGAGLTPRDRTPAGRLERLAQRQNDNDRRLEQMPGSSTEQQPLADEQASIAHDAEKLTAEYALANSVQGPASEASLAAHEAARQLALRDTQAAREPAIEAQSSFQRAVEIQEHEGRKAADALLEQVRQELNAASRAGNQAAQAAEILKSQRQLNAEAERQQQQGSATAAQELAQLANQLGNSNQSSVANKKSPSPSPSRSGAPQGQGGAQSASSGSSSPQGQSGSQAKPPSDGAPPSQSSSGAHDAPQGQEGAQSASSGSSSPQGESGSQGKPSSGGAPSSQSSSGAHGAPQGQEGAQSASSGSSSSQGQSGSQGKPSSDGAPSSQSSSGAHDTSQGQEGAQSASSGSSSPQGQSGSQGKPSSGGAPSSQSSSGAHGAPQGQEGAQSASSGSSSSQGQSGSQGKPSSDGAPSSQSSSGAHDAPQGQEGAQSASSGSSSPQGQSGSQGKPPSGGAPSSQSSSGAHGAPQGQGGAQSASSGSSSPQGQPGSQGKPSSDGAPAQGESRVGGSTIGVGGIGETFNDEAASRIAKADAVLFPDGAVDRTIRQLDAVASVLTDRVPTNPFGRLRLSNRDPDPSIYITMLENAAQQAEYITGDDRQTNLAREIVRKVRSGVLFHRGTIDPSESAALAASARQLANELEQARSGSQRDERIRGFAPEAIDPDYRKAVEDYFEFLSRQGVAR